MSNLPEKRRLPRSFCILAWTNFFCFPSGEMAPCCAASNLYRKEDGAPCSIERDDPATVWNGPIFKKLRQEMLDGVESPICRTCHDNERRRMTSHRRNMNRLYFGPDADDDLYDMTIFRGRLAQPDIDEVTCRKPCFLDIRLGNLCNLKCRMCFPSTSSQIEHDPVVRLWSDDDQDRSFGATVEDWPEAAGLLDRLKDFCNEAVRFELAGGESPLNPSQTELLQSFVDSGQSRRMHLQVTSNFTSINERFYRMVDSFGSVELFASLDGVGPVNDYIRFPSRWAVVSENVKTIRQKYPRFEVLVSPAYLAYNILSVTDLWEWCLVNGFKLSTQNLLVRPPYLQCGVLPEEARQLAARRIEFWLCRHFSQTPVVMRQNMLALSAHLRNPATASSEEDIEKFVGFTNDLDRSRGQSIKESLPELYEIWSRCRGWDHSKTKYYLPDAQKLLAGMGAA